MYTDTNRTLYVVRYMYTDTNRTLYAVTYMYTDTNRTLYVVMYTDTNRTLYVVRYMYTDTNRTLYVVRYKVVVLGSRALTCCLSSVRDSLGVFLQFVELVPQLLDVLEGSVQRPAGRPAGAVRGPGD